MYYYNVSLTYYSVLGKYQNFNRLDTDEDEATKVNFEDRNYHPILIVPNHIEETN